MGESGGFNGDNNVDLPGGSFSRLLLSIDDIQRSNSSFYQTSPLLFSSNTPNMLCFGDFNSEMSQNFPYLTSNNYSHTLSASSCGNVTTMLSNKRRSGPGQESGLGSENGQKNGRKKNKPEMAPTITTNTNLVGHAKGKREKLGERISALQQLVCPYGKTDTASVLHEAIGYIRFLQEQVKVLSSPYLPSSTSPRHLRENIAPVNEKAYDTTKCLRSRGLCLVPVEYIVDVANTNGADFWSSATSLSAP